MVDWLLVLKMHCLARWGHKTETLAILVMIDCLLSLILVQLVGSLDRGLIVITPVAVHLVLREEFHVVN